MGKKITQEESITLSRWLIEKTDTEAYRAGRLTGKKKPKNGTITEMMLRLGGRQALLDQASELEHDP